MPGADAVQIHKHEPERRRAAATTLHCGCTCCCCCCLHTIGSLIGASVAPTIGRGAPVGSLTSYYDEEVPLRIRTGLSAVAFHWWLLLGLVGVGFGIPFLTDPHSSGSILIAGVIIALVLPGMQLASAVIALIVFGLWPRPDRGFQLRQLGKVIAGTLLGGFAGLVAMAGIGALFGAFR
jgi:hypothetical protein